MKQHTTLTVDFDLIQKAKIMNINMSKTFNDVLRSMVANSNNNGIDILKIREEREEINDQILKLKSKDNELLAQELAFNESKKQNDQTKLKELLKQGEAIKRSGVLEDL